MSKCTKRVILQKKTLLNRLTLGVVVKEKQQHVESSGIQTSFWYLTLLRKYISEYLDGHVGHETLY